jgi:hypothetical protein
MTAAKKGMTLKPLSARKAPEPAEGHQVIDEWMGRAMPDLQPILKELDATIRQEVPGLLFAVKWKKAYYGLPEQGWIIELVAYDVSVNVVFFGGDKLSPPPELGTDGRGRYVKLKTLDEARDTTLRTWIRQAARAGGWK